MEIQTIPQQTKTWTGTQIPLESVSKQDELDYSTMEIPGYHPFEEFARALEEAVEKRL